MEAAFVMFLLSSKFAKLFAVVVLLFTLGCSEFPELIRLSDNTCNDFTTQSCIADTITIAAVTEVRAKASWIARGEEFFNFLQRRSLFCISPDLLLLYSILRT
jgi:hypothetical protein